MTEREKMERAKMYIDKLANGIDPLTDKTTPDSDIVNNVRISRCLFYVSDILQKAIESDNDSSNKKMKKRPFFIDFEKRKQYAYSDKPISVSEITAKIDGLAEDGDMQKMKYSSITTWLEEIGMLASELSPTGEWRKHPTHTGEEIGISLEERVGAQGSYYVVVYNGDAQHFIIDNLDAIFTAENERNAMQGKPWTQGQDECLMELCKKKAPMSEIVITLKRSASSVRARMKKLGLANR